MISPWTAIRVYFSFLLEIRIRHDYVYPSRSNRERTR